MRPGPAPPDPRQRQPVRRRRRCRGQVDGHRAEADVVPKPLAERRVRALERVVPPRFARPRRVQRESVDAGTQRLRVGVVVAQRLDGSVMGYVLGGTDAWRVASGSVVADHLTLTIELWNPVTTRQFTIEGAVTVGPTPETTYLVAHASPAVDLTAATTGTNVDPGSQAEADPSSPVVWHMTGEAITERKFGITTGGGGGWFAVSVAVKGESGLVSGTMFMAGPCEGADCPIADVFDMVEDETGRLTLLFETFDGMMLTMNVAPVGPEPTSALSKLLTGTSQIPIGPATAVDYPIYAFQGMRTTSAHAAHMLATYARIADDLVAHTDFSMFGSANPYPPVAATYRHDNPTVGAGPALAALQAQVVDFAPSKVVFSRFRNLATLPDPRGFPLFPAAFGVDFSDYRAGTHDAVPDTVYFDRFSDPPYDALRFLTVDTVDGIDDVRLVGNQSDGPDLGLPLAPQDLATLRDFAPFAVRYPNQNQGTSSFRFAFPPDTTPRPSVVTPVAMDVQFALTSDPFKPACQAGADSTIIARTGVYSVEQTAASCTLGDFSATIPMGTAIGVPMDYPGYPADMRSEFTAQMGLSRPFCPFWRMGPGAREQVLALRNQHPYPEELTEPFLCNPGLWQSMAASTLTWRLTSPETRNRNAPVSFTITRSLARNAPFFGEGNVPIEIAADYAGGQHLTASLVCQSPQPGDAAHWVCTGQGDGHVLSMRITATATATGAYLELDPNGPGLGATDVYFAGDVPALCDDGNPCTDDVMIGPGVCVHSNNTAPCYGGDKCLVHDRCVDGACVPGDARDCDDGNVCTDDSCDSAVGCQYTNNVNPCDDNNACTVVDACVEGQCQGTDPIVCTAIDACHVAGTCDTQSGTCSNPDAPKYTSCSDGDACTLWDWCESGVCVGRLVQDCPAQDQCHDNGTCDSTTGLCQYPPRDDGTPCDDMDRCTTVDQCEAGACVGSVPPDCDDGNPCTDDACYRFWGCYHTPNADPCDDGDACTVNDVCYGGHCTAGNHRDCYDGNICTHDDCDPAFGCLRTPTDYGCDDGNPCTVYDGCADGTCQPGTPLNCDDMNPCTNDSCDPASGCVHEANTAPCDDFDACTLNDTCAGGGCVGGEAPDCDDGNVCTEDLCDAGPGCHHLPAWGPCDDHDRCTTDDACDNGGGCRGVAVVCTPIDQCHAFSSCIPETGQCSTELRPVGAFCNDGDRCTREDHCDATGACVGGDPVVCLPLDACHVEGVCDSATGACSNPAQDDGTECLGSNPCFQNHACQAGVCTGTNPLVCTALDQCHVAGTCNPATGRCNDERKPDGDACDDRRACTQTDKCLAGVCSGSNPVVCRAPTQCEQEVVCDERFGTCHPVPKQDGTACSDGNACTAPDRCNSGQCLAGAAVDCDDGSTCTYDACDPVGGCTHANNEATCAPAGCSGAVFHHAAACLNGSCPPPLDEDCDDGNACTVDQCTNNGCISTPILCDDGNVCTDDSCDPETGDCAHWNNQVPCGPVATCNGDEYVEQANCVDGACQSQAVVSCNDDNPCTDDWCNPLSGCSHTDNEVPCSDGDPCTIDESCHYGSCTGAPITCSQGSFTTVELVDGQSYRNSFQFFPVLEYRNLPPDAIPIGGGVVANSPEAGAQLYAFGLNATYLRKQTSAGLALPLPIGLDSIDLAIDIMIRFSDGSTLTQTVQIPARSDSRWTVVPDPSLPNATIASTLDPEKLMFGAEPDTTTVGALVASCSTSTPYQRVFDETLLNRVSPVLTRSFALWPGETYHFWTDTLVPVGSHAPDTVMHLFRADNNEWIASSDDGNLPPPDDLASSIFYTNSTAAPFVVNVVVHAFSTDSIAIGLRWTRSFGQRSGRSKRDSRLTDQR